MGTPFLTDSGSKQATNSGSLPCGLINSHYSRKTYTHPLQLPFAHSTSPVCKPSSASTMPRRGSQSSLPGYHPSRRSTIPPLQASPMIPRPNNALMRTKPSRGISPKRANYSAPPNVNPSLYHHVNRARQHYQPPTGHTNQRGPHLCHPSRKTLHQRHGPLLDTRSRWEPIYHAVAPLLLQHHLSHPILHQAHLP